jgi:hypothetical protein
MHWHDIPGWFLWRPAQEEAARHFGEGSRVALLPQAQPWPTNQSRVVVG